MWYHISMKRCPTCKQTIKSIRISRSGYRESLGYFRSSWEANIARYLNYLKKNKIIKDWKYEPKRFIFDKIKRGTTSYLPDFQVFFKDRIEWWEVKGYWRQKGKTAVRRFRKYFPEEILIIIAKKEYIEIQKEHSSQIKDWEY